MKKDIRIKTLSPADMQEIARRYGEEEPAVSFYLGVRAGQNFLVAANSALSQEKQRLAREKSFTPAERVRLLAILGEIEDYLRAQRLPDRTRSFVIFSRSPRRLESFRLPVYVPTRLLVGRQAFVHPLIRGAQQYPHYAVVVLERDRARLFDVRWGEIETASARIQSEVPQRMNTARAPNRGVEERKIRNHIEVHIDRHLKKVAAAAEDFLSAAGADYLLIGSRRELTGRLEPFLSPPTRAKIVGSFTVRSDESLRLIQARSLEAVRAREARREEELLGKIEEGRSKKNPQAVLGTAAVLGALGRYRVHLLALGRGYTAPGFACVPCGAAALRSGKCRLCGGRLRPAEDIADELLAMALEQGVRIVHFLDPHPDFDRAGVGALLK